MKGKGKLTNLITSYMYSFMSLLVEQLWFMLKCIRTITDKHNKQKIQLKRALLETIKLLLFAGLW